MKQDRIDELLSGSMNVGSGIGLANTNRRLKGLFKSGLEICSELGKGTTVRFRVMEDTEEYDEI